MSAKSRQRLRRHRGACATASSRPTSQAEIGQVCSSASAARSLAWGETDVFRLLDNINPLDNSFGGFLVPLDERRVPLDMLRISYQIGDIP